MKRFRVVRIVLHGHVEVLIGRADVAFLERLHTLRQIDLGHLCQIGRGSADADVELGIMLPPAHGVREHVHRFGQRLEFPLRLGFVGAFVAVGMILADEPSESLPDLLLGGGTLYAEHVVIVDLH